MQHILTLHCESLLLSWTINVFILSPLDHIQEGVAEIGRMVINKQLILSIVPLDCLDFSHLGLLELAGRHEVIEGFEFESEEFLKVGHDPL